MDTEDRAGQWALRVTPRTWQAQALDLWERRGRRGIARIVTGGGKTTFAFMCMNACRSALPDAVFVIIVPTIALLDQWYVGLQDDLGVRESELAVYAGHDKAKRPRLVNLLVLNTARQVDRYLPADLRRRGLLIVDECHRAATPLNASALGGEYAATLGLSATPEREYDAGFEEYLRPALGEVLLNYGYADAYRDGVITPFALVNVRVPLTSKEQDDYSKLSRRILVASRKAGRGQGSEEYVQRLLQRRGSLAANAQYRIPVAVRLVERHRGSRTLVFHESVAAATKLHELLRSRGHSATLYHSQIGSAVRRDNLRLFRRGVYEVLICCRALDEGMNVPETSVAIVASSTASQRQRIQRLGRVLRPARGKSGATIYTLFATDLERSRLVAEAEKLGEITDIRWQQVS